MSITAGRLILCVEFGGGLFQVLRNLMGKLRRVPGIFLRLGKKLVKALPAGSSAFG